MLEAQLGPREGQMRAAPGTALALGLLLISCSVCWPKPAPSYAQIASIEPPSDDRNTGGDSSGGNSSGGDSREGDSWGGNSSGGNSSGGGGDQSGGETRSSGDQSGDAGNGQGNT